VARSNSPVGKADDPMWCLILVVDGMFNKSIGIATLSAAQTVMAAMMELHCCLIISFWPCHHFATLVDSIK